jgi:hypothetical protein
MSVEVVIPRPHSPIRPVPRHPMYLYGLPPKQSAGSKYLSGSLIRQWPVQCKLEHIRVTLRWHASYCKSYHFPLAYLFTQSLAVLSNSLRSALY